MIKWKAEAITITVPREAFHVSYTFERNPTGRRREGYAAVCETCGTSTSGGIETRRKALDALRHSTET